MRRTLPLLLLAALPSAAAAQPPGDALPARWQSLTAMPGRGSTQSRELRAAIQAGDVDPLALLRHLSARVTVPPGAVYQRACSAALGTGETVFSLGGGLSDATRASLDGLQRELRGGRPDPREQARLTFEFANAVNSAPGIPEARAFYREAGFEELPVYAYVPFEWAGDPDGRRLAVVLWGANPRAAAGSQGIPACEAMPKGPAAILSVR